LGKDLDMNKFVRDDSLKIGLADTIEAGKRK